ncbi:hypothetical protein BHM03_00025045 [Ensete ventricosum]|nr:hypothetical protein BHM03_00025045 [Ensete ventricosum]
MAALARRQPLCQGAATPTAGTSTGAAPASAAAVGGRPCKRQPLRAVPLPAGCLPAGAEPAVGRPLRAGATLQPTALGRLPLRSGLGRSRSPLCRGPCRSRPPFAWGALATTGRHLQVAWPQPAAPLQVAGRPCKEVGRGHAWLPLARASFAIRMEKMKEVKRPPLSWYSHDGSLQRNSSNLISQLLRRGREENRRWWLKL